MTQTTSGTAVFAIAIDMCDIRKLIHLQKTIHKLEQCELTRNVPSNNVDIGTLNTLPLAVIFVADTLLAVNSAKPLDVTNEDEFFWKANTSTTKKADTLHLHGLRKRFLGVLLL